MKRIIVFFPILFAGITLPFLILFCLEDSKFANWYAKKIDNLGEWAGIK